MLKKKYKYDEFKNMLKTKSILKKKQNKEKNIF